MLEVITGWLAAHIVEVSGAILGILYIFFSIKQSIYTWPTGLLTSLLYIYVFFQSKFYADMALQVYYVGISIYGWYFWLKGGKTNNKKEVPLKRASLKLLLPLSLCTLVIYFTILYILLYHTDSPVPYLDSLTTTLSIVATWMLARKIIEHWLIWIFTDLLSAGMYIYKGLWATTILFIVYTVMACIGYFQWKKEFLKNE